MVRTELDPHALMAALGRIEEVFGRQRRTANAPRTLDLDLIAYGRLAGEQDGLVVPHPRAHQRKFVMGPLAEISPWWRHPVTGEEALQLAARAPIGADARPITD